MTTDVLKPEEAIPLYGEVYTIIIKNREVAKGVYVGSKKGTHVVLIREDGIPKAYFFRIPFFLSLVGTPYITYNLEDHKLTLSSRKRISNIPEKERDLANKILEERDL